MRKSKIVVASVAAFALVGALGLAGCGGGSTQEAADEGAEEATEAVEGEEATEPAEAVELTVFAANSLQKALPDVEALYVSQNPNVSFVESETGYAASGTLVETLTADPTAADLLITASSGSMDDAEAAELVVSDTRADMFTNDLVMAVAENSEITISDVTDIQTNDAIATVYMGEPNTVPAGNYTLQTLVSAGLATGDKTEYSFDESIAGKMNDGADKVGTVATYIAEDAASTGFVYTSDIYRYDGIKIAYTVPADMHKNIIYPGAVCAQSANADAAAAFMDFCMNDPEAQAIFASYGFELAA